VSGEIQIKFDLHPAQMEVFQNQHRFRSLVAGRRFGKTHLAITEGCCAALDDRNSKRLPVFLIAPTQPQAKLLYWRPLIDKMHSVIDTVNVNEGLMYLKNGVLLGVKGADNPDALRGTGLYFAALDEYASMKPFVWPEIIRPALADVRGRALFIGTPDGRNHFYDLHQYASSGEDADWAGFQFTSLDNPFLPSGEVEAARRSLSSAAFNKEFMASFDTAGGGTFKEEWIITSDIEPKDGSWFVVIDLAGFSNIARATTHRTRALDEHVIATVKVTPEGEWWVKDMQFGRWGIKETANRILDTLESVKPTAWGIEKGALFNAVWPVIQGESAIRKIDMIGSPIPLSHENRVKGERITWALQGRFEHGRIKLKPGKWNRKLIDQLLMFPSAMVHDDGPDALSYTAQISQGRVFFDFSGIEDKPYWAPQDTDIGF
jgi:predicted phage terminase large subunit-like protein